MCKALMDAPDTKDPNVGYTSCAPSALHQSGTPNKTKASFGHYYRRARDCMHMSAERSRACMPFLMLADSQHFGAGMPFCYSYIDFRSC